ncbi:DUF1997 domain-containing protein [Desertifilum sp. FACHB-1129]|uniref:DUF1997 domain-containing protein n=1 Tax=Desertifilum tharense IPPAS B-1220 TaxID=1781255 RepID=A0A1E5QCI6_9CYAN|nr:MULTISPECIES: DUF1997 domain-containing protein [Desertifilum]MDA0210860.1 DUF1997 domain-containing protein [Cyanobacteria bacterium FC1]MBD2312093.1 DUF1997 domain-containing protein [Desertifilum sp. FACHB-1129]MBD2322246.1 DUF1997 domain-containing protein [Desertifilum sp. FACHB-866]MBD2332283.1 DUF1997 domain-containing protein [Desertifilum sp. FACHB-868]OEJ72359.1 hypothetical protein BH720_25100 [Desertifilum tharense IPPAS B-1220]
MPTRFAASQSVEMAVPELVVPIQHYLRQPQRLVNALTGASQIESLSEERYRLKMRSLNFMTLSFQPTVDLKVWSESGGTIHLKSMGCEIRGIEYINQRFALNLVGKLSPISLNGQTYLKGRADLEVSVELPPPLSFAPTSLIETTGNGLLRSVLLTIKQRLMHQLIADYRHWVQAETGNPERTSRTIVPAETPL